MDDHTVVPFHSKGTLAELTRSAAWAALTQALLELQGVESVIVSVEGDADISRK